MHRMTALISLALLGLSGSALAGDLDEVATSGLSELDESTEYGALARSQRNQSRSKGNKTQTRSQRSNGNKTATRTQRSNGNKSMTRLSGEKQSRWNNHKSTRGGDYADIQGRRSQTRDKVEVTNGTKSASRSWGSERTQQRANGMRKGEVVDATRTHGQDRLRTRMSNHETGKRFGVTDRRTFDHKVGQRGNVSHDRFTSSHGSRVRGNGTPRMGQGPPVNGRGPNVPRHASSAAARPGPRPGNAARPGADRPGGGPGDARRPGDASRPGSTIRPGGGARPGHAGDSRTTVRTTTRSVHAGPRNSTIVVRGGGGGGRRTVHYTHVRPYHGVFVYGPRPVTHTHYHSGGGGGGVKVKRNDLPTREIDRANSVAVGIKGGSLVSGYFDGPAYSDLGLGIAGRYRPAESVGLELAVQHHDQTWTSLSERSQTQIAGSVELFAFPWTRVSPYAIAGVTYNARNVQDEILQSPGLTVIDRSDDLWGLHGGLGVELAMGQSLALDLEGRYIGYIDREPTDATFPGALQLNAGLMVHF